MQNLNGILEIFENFEKNLKNNFEEIFRNFPICLSFQINFPNHHVSGKNFGGGGTSPPSEDSKNNFWMGARVPPGPHGPPMVFFSSAIISV